MTNTFPRVAASALFLGILTGVAPSVRAEPIQVTSGGATIAWDDPSGFGVFSADGLALTGFFTRVISSPQSICAAGCAPGTIVNLSSVMGSDTGFGLGQSMTAHVNGVSYARPDDFTTWLNLSGLLRFTAGDVVLPPFPAEPTRVVVSAPFAFEGQVTGFARGDLGAANPLFVVDLIGSGEARLSVGFSRELGVYRTPEASYTFADPIPEPASLALAGTGLAVLLLRRRSRESLSREAQPGRRS